jgi:MFS family permease
MTLVATYLLHNPPAGYRPEGWDPATARTAARGGADMMASDRVRTQTFWALCVAGILGPYLGGRVLFATGEYRWAFFIAAGVSIVALATLFLAKNPHAAPVKAVPVRV